MPYEQLQQRGSPKLSEASKLLLDYQLFNRLDRHDSECSQSDDESVSPRYLYRRRELQERMLNLLTHGSFKSVRRHVDERPTDEILFDLFDKAVQEMHARSIGARVVPSLAVRAEEVEALKSVWDESGLEVPVCGCGRLPIHWEWFGGFKEQKGLK